MWRLHTLQAELIVKTSYSQAEAAAKYYLCNGRVEAAQTGVAAGRQGALHVIYRDCFDWGLEIEQLFV